MRQVIGDVPLGGSPFPPIADYAFLSDCEVCALVAPSGNVEWMCLPRFDGAVGLRRDARPRRRHLPARPGRHVGAGRPPLPAGHDGPRDDLGHADGLGDRPRRAADRARGTTTTSARTPTAARRPTTTPTTCCCARCAASTARVEMQHGLRADARLRAHGASVGVRRRRLRPGGRHAPRAATSSCALTTDLRIGFEGGARPRAHDAARRRHRVRRAVVERARRRRDLRRGLPARSSAPPTSGTSGSPTATSPTTRGAPTCSAAR